MEKSLYLCPHSHANSRCSMTFLLRAMPVPVQFLDLVNARSIVSVTFSGEGRATTADV